MDEHHAANDESATPEGVPPEGAGRQGLTDAEIERLENAYFRRGRPDAPDARPFETAGLEAVDDEHAGWYSPEGEVYVARESHRHVVIARVLLEAGGRPPDEVAAMPDAEVYRVMFGLGYVRWYGGTLYQRDVHQGMTTNYLGVEYASHARETVLRLVRGVPHPFDVVRAHERDTGRRYDGPIDGFAEDA